MDEQLTDRKKRILKAIIKTYMETGEPVGSRTISKDKDLNVSSATIRNEMSDLEEMGYTCTQYAFTDVNDLSAVTQSACDGSDVIYIPTDNTAANNTETIANVVIPAGVPVVCGESGICSGCGVATLSISYYDLGYTTGEMAVKILKGESNVSDMPIEYTDVTKKYNKTICDDLGLTAPEGYEAIEG